MDEQPKRGLIYRIPGTKVQRTPHPGHVGHRRTHYPFHTNVAAQYVAKSIASVRDSRSERIAGVEENMVA